MKRGKPDRQYRDQTASSRYRERNRVSPGKIIEHAGNPRPRRSSEDRELIHQRYTANCPIDELVERLGISRRTLFRNLDRIRRTLFECIRLQGAS